MSRLGSIRRGFGRRFWVVGATLVAAAAFGVIFIAASGAAPPPCPTPANFEIDGDMTAGNCVSGADDWSNVSPAQTSQGGTYSTSGKDNSDPSTWTSTGSTPDKTDFTQAYATSRIGTDGDFYVFVAWERTFTSGTQGYAIELTNAGANLGADGKTPQPNRSKGGSVFFIASQGGALPAFDSSCNYTSQSNYGQSCSTSSLGFYSAFNTSPFTDPITGLAQAAGGFYEVGLDVTALTGIKPSCPGPTAATVYLRSVTGQVSNGNLKGYMAPLEVAPDSTCVPPPITTTATPGGSVNDTGSPQHDTVTVGTQQAPGSGSVTFFLCSPSEVTANGGDCSKNGTQVSSTTLTNGQASSGTVRGSSTPNDNATGKYCWRAEFTPDANDHNYLPGSETNSLATGAAGDECFIIVPPALTLTKTADDASVSAGDQIGFTVTASNSSAAGTGTAQGVVIDDPLPGGPGIDWSIPSGLPANCSVQGSTPSQTLHCTAVDLAAGQSESVHVVSGTAFESCAAYPNEASLTASNNPPLTADATTTVECPDLSLSKTADNTTVSAGEQIGFTITASNSDVQGAGTAHDVVLNDPLPAGGDVDWSIAAGPQNCSITGGVGSQTLHCSAVDLGPGESESVHVVSDTSSESCATYPNVATATASNHATLTADASTTVLCAEIHIVKTADAAKVNIGSPIGFTLTVSSGGSGDAHGVTLSDTLPTNPGLSWTIASQGAGWGGSCAIAAGVLTCGPVTVPAGTTQAKSTFTVHIRSSTTAATGGDCPGSGTVNNTGDVTTSNAGSDESTASTCVQALVDLSITKAGSPATQDLGQGNITWTIVVTNNGPSADTGVAITDPMPAGNTFVSATSTKGSCTGGAVLTCNIGNMAAGETVTITLVTTPSTTGSQVNTATVSGNRPETNTNNNRATATVQVTAPITPPVVYCVAVSKVTPAQLFVGRKTTLTIHVTQHGRAKAGVRVLIRGPHFLKRTARSNAKGVIKQQVKMKKAGAMIFTPIASKRCNTKRIGVTGVFTPPVTG
jgi:uncharacterized repeat protein (TIGR01451 family)